ncbi:cell division protein ZapE [Wigglesworthia glossinidia]|nr:cell division protein ZapE [Wigglesworthia glossinidia]
MNLFYQSVPTNRKMRIHFHEFMIKIHKDMYILQGKKNPLKIVAKNFKNKVDIICFDEFFISDIADAMLLGNLIKYFLKVNILLIITSNFPPCDLYKDGLQRSQFLPTIELIYKYYTILNLDSGVDYRLLNVHISKFWLYPINEKNINKMKKLFFKFIGNKNNFKKNVNIEINHRKIKTLWLSNKISAFNFKDLCISSCSQNDYIVIAQKFAIIFLYNVIQIDNSQEDVGKRFLFLIDALYANRVKLITISSVCISQIYNGDLLKFEYNRCISRLYEMQSEKYFVL